MKTILWTLILSFTALVFYAINKKPIGESGQMLISDPWGVVTLIDLYIGFFIFSLFLFLNESSKISATLWTIALLILGNGVSLLYITVHLNQILKKLKT